MLRYFITDRKQLADENALLRRVERACAAGVDYVCLREKDVSARELERLARRVRAIVRGATRFIVHSRADVALAVGADGLHLASGPHELRPAEVRAAWMKSAMVPALVVSCHTVAEVAAAESHGADMVVFGPVFEKAGTRSPDGLERLAAACKVSRLQVLALGGVNQDNAAQCIAAGASGIAGIRLFQG